MASLTNASHVLTTDQRPITDNCILKKTPNDAGVFCLARLEKSAIAVLIHLFRLAFAALAFAAFAFLLGLAFAALAFTAFAFLLGFAFAALAFAAFTFLLGFAFAALAFTAFAFSQLHVAAGKVLHAKRVGVSVYNR